MSHEHQHSITIEPKELSSGSILATSNLSEEDNIAVSNNRVSLQTIGHDGIEDAPSMLSPIELILVSLARSTIQVLRLAIEVKGLEINNLHVAVSQQREENDMIVTREIIIDGHASDEEREALKDMAERCPIQKLLRNGTTVETVIA